VYTNQVAEPSTPSTATATRARLTFWPRVSGGVLTSGMAAASSRASRLTRVELTVLPQAPSGAAGSFRRANDGPRASGRRQSIGSDLTSCGTLMIRWHSGHGACLPASSLLTEIFSSHCGHWNSMAAAALTGAGSAGLSARASAAKDSTSTGGDTGCPTGDG